jgi:galactose-1-phosphate uridylyltransferase
VRRRARSEETLEAERARLDDLIAEEYQERTAEVKRVLAAARAELTSTLTDEARRLGEERRVEFAERERRGAAEYSMRLVQVQKRVEDRLTAWTHDLERTTGEIEGQVARLEARLKERLAQFERTLTQEAEALRTESDDQRVAVMRLREEIQNAAAEAIQAATADLEQMSAERRRALHEVGERLRRRERDLRELIEREEVDAAQRLTASFNEVERRQAERLARSL